MPVFFDNPDDPTHDRELGCNPLMPSFIKEELLPAVLDANNIIYDPKNMLIIGSSFGGLGALYAGFTAPASFPKIISLSGYLGFGGEIEREDQWLVSEYAKKEALPLQIYLSVGSLQDQAFLSLIVECATSWSEKATGIATRNIEAAMIMSAGNTN